MTASKRALRQQMRDAITALDPTARQRQSAAVVSRVRALLPEGLVLGYVALPDEVDVGPLIQGPCALPRVRGERLVLHRVDGLRGLVEGPWGLKEPAASAPVVSLSDLGAVIVPGRAYDRSGRRLGRGGGYYDRALAPGPLRIGVCFDEQLVDAVPHEPHDQKVDVVVTARETLWTGDGRG